MATVELIACWYYELEQIPRLRSAYTAKKHVTKVTPTWFGPRGSMKCKLEACTPNYQLEEKKTYTHSTLIV